MHDRPAVVVAERHLRWLDRELVALVRPDVGDVDPHEPVPVGPALLVEQADDVADLVDDTAGGEVTRAEQHGSAPWASAVHPRDLDEPGVVHRDREQLVAELMPEGDGLPGREDPRSEGDGAVPRPSTHHPGDGEGAGRVDGHGRQLVVGLPLERDHGARQERSGGPDRVRPVPRVRLLHPGHVQPAVRRDRGRRQLRVGLLRKRHGRAGREERPADGHRFVPGIIALDPGHIQPSVGADHSCGQHVVGLPGQRDRAPRRRERVLRQGTRESLYAARTPDVLDKARQRVAPKTTWSPGGASRLSTSTIRITVRLFHSVMAAWSRVTADEPGGKLSGSIR
jgi:hypothetical protein